MLLLRLLYMHVDEAGDAVTLRMTRGEGVHGVQSTRVHHATLEQVYCCHVCHLTILGSESQSQSHLQKSSAFCDPTVLLFFSIKIRRHLARNCISSSNNDSEFVIQGSCYMSLNYQT
nr:hypothetical protein Iba_chr12dCG18120 [Ipomoea batatas]